MRNAPGRKPKPYSQAVRALHLVDYLRARRRPVPLRELAADFDISERQARRDLACLEEAGFDIAWETLSGRSAVRLSSADRGTVLRLSARERYALLAVRRVFAMFADTPLGEDVARIYDKVLATLPEEHRADAEALADRFAYLPSDGVKSYRGKEDVLDALMTGALRRLRVRSRYRSPTGHVTRGLLEPFAVVMYRQGLYVVGRFEGADVKTYAVERFTSAQHLRGDTFDVPEDFSVEARFQGTFGIFAGGEPEDVVIDLAPEIAHLIRERRLHPSQKVTRRQGGGVRLRLRVTQTPELVRWVLGWGAKAEVVGPEGLREVVRGARVG